MHDLFKTLYLQMISLKKENVTLKIEVFFNSCKTDFDFKIDSHQPCLAK